MAVDQHHDHVSGNSHPSGSGDASPEIQPEEGSCQESWLASKATALELCQGGHYEEAEQIYRQLIAEGFSDASVYCNLGNLCRLNGRKQEGLELLHKSIRVDPHHANGFFNIGIVYQQDANNPIEAIRSYRKALACNPQLKLALRNQGVSFYSLGRAWGAFICFKRYFSLTSSEPALLLDTARLNNKLYPNVIAAYQGRLEVEPSDSSTAICLSIALREVRLFEQAALANAVCLSASPNCAQLWLEQACCLMELGDMTQTIAACDEVLKLEPENFNAYFTRGNAFRNTGNLVEAERSMQSAVTLNPEFADALVNLAIYKRDQGLLDEAIGMFKQAISLNTTHPEGWEGLLFSYSIGGTRYRNEVLSASEAYWGILAQEAAATPKDASKAARLKRRTSKVSNQAVSSSKATQQCSKPRIGILSAEIGHHVVSTFLDSFLSYYNRETLEVELIVPSQRKESGTIELASKASAFINLQGKDEEAARELLRSRSYDILIETSGHTEHNSLKLLSQRCAPIQCHYIGYHATTGLATIDYILADYELLPHELDPFFIETPWRLTRPWLACMPYAEPPLAISTAQSAAPVWGSFGQVAKIREETLAHWACALRAVPTATLVIKDRNTVFEVARERILESLERQGVARNRVCFLPWTKTWLEHMLCHNQIDIALDTTPWSSSTTAFNALAMGVPLVAIRGQTMAARMSASIVSGLGKPEWICETEEEFAATLVKLSNTVPALRASKQLLQADVLGSQLFDGKDLTQHLESAFSQMITSHAQANPLLIEL
ncbi:MULTISPECIES: tetratricopeptide repeat protein [Synechococcales]|uniref:tetratricopeptide repeat protein n=1 Tax=Synechococcus sp. CS-1333 TaxID=2848638 RepID=UPI00223C2F28|nr:tetratricopeptide repeat protein [Synechococcus sp. CS-1333]MCT0210724.1 tetratricopeptide repeat protein [Synechococcus sp. CS-1333]